MEPLDLTCPKCNATCELLKAEGLMACPHCNAIYASPTITSSSAPTVPAPVPSEIPVTAEKPAETADPKEISPLVPASIPVTPTHSIPSLASQARPTVDDADDPNVRADYDDRYDARRRSGTHPLLRVFIILMILFILVPVAIVILVAVVCAVMFAGR